LLHVAVAAADDVQLHGVTDGSEDDVRKPSVWTNIVGPAVSLQHDNYKKFNYC